MNAEIIAVGTEILLGQIVNTNAQYLSEQLSKLAINVYNQSVVGDNAERLTEAIQNAFAKSDMVIFTGGLGPTKDDLTKETVAAYFGLPLVRDEASLKNMQARFCHSQFGEMPESNKKQADMPKGCIILKNDDGTAPGGIIEKDGKIAVFLPGPPNEMQLMFSRYVMPYLREKCPEQFFSVVVNLIGIGESLLAEKLAYLIDNQTDPTIAPYAKEGEVTLRVTSKARTKEEAMQKIRPMLDEIKTVAGDYVYGYDNLPLEQVVADLLQAKSYTLTTAESCTGGLLGAHITNVPGISSYYKEGFITYSNEAKETYLGVKPETLQKFGAVSRQTAEEMARGARSKTGADVAAAITGVAGPDGGTAEKPVGLVYIAVADRNGCVVKKFHFSGDRQKVRRLSAKNALNMLRLLLK